ncbi:MAG: BatD family protein [Gemmatimonadales bacterium]|jgi:hypothetical protein
MVAGKVAGHAGRQRRAMTTAMVIVMVTLLTATQPGASDQSLAGGHGEQPTVEASVDSTAITVGGRVQLTVTVEHDAGTVVTWPDSLDLGPFEVLDATVLEPQRLNGRVRSTERLTLTAFELGELEIPRFDVRVAGPDSAATTILSTRALPVTVASVGRDETGELRGIKGPLAIARNWLLLWPWVLGLSILAAALWLFRRYRARRQPEPAQAPKTPPRPPHELAYEALDRLEREGLLDSGKIKAHYIEVSDIIRTYIEGRYGIEALELATHEVMAGLQSVELVPEMRQEFEWFFEECDLVKFAKLIPDPVACRAIVPAARRLVDGTRPIEREPADSAVSTGTKPVSATSETVAR